MVDTPEVMFDTIGTTAGNIPSNASKVAGYNTGTNGVAWSEADWNRFPKAGKVIMCQDANYSTWHTADGGDVEPGAMTVAGFVAGALKRQAIGWNTVAYVDKDNVASLVKACNEAKLTKIQLWIGDWELNLEQASSQLGQTVGGYEIVAVQWASPTSNPDTIVPGGTQTLREANLDLSTTLPEWFSGTPVEVPTPPPVVAPPVTTPAPPVVRSTTAALEITGADGYTTSVQITTKDNGQTWTFG